MSAGSRGAGIFRFVKSFIAGDNVSIRLCIIEESQDVPPTNEDVLDEISAICYSKSIPLSIVRLICSDQIRLFRLASFSDLLIIEKPILQHLTIGHDFSVNSCASIAVPADFDSISNILLVVDGTPHTIEGVKQFFQTFPDLVGRSDVNVLSLEGGDSVLSTEEELLFLAYLKQYNKSLAILKVEEPITGKLLKPVQYDDHTIVVGNINYLLSKYGEEEIFKPFFDNKSSLFFPSLIEG
ncbi:MAG: hypothetical protein AAGC47_02470 [Bacteroidota bacterium]